MQPKDSKKLKTVDHQGSNIASKNKRIDNNVLIKKILTKSKGSKTPLDNDLHSQKHQEVKNNKLTKNINTENKTNTKEKTQKRKSINVFQTKLGNDKSLNKMDSSTKSKISSKLSTGEKKPRKNTAIPKKNINKIEYKKSPYIRSKTTYINSKKRKDILDKKNKNEGSMSEIGTRKLLEFLSSLSPLDSNKYGKLLNKNISKIIELENKIKKIIIQTQEEIEDINKKENINININNEDENMISLEQNIEIINKESKMRKDIYVILFEFIKEILEQINKLSYNIANQELIELNNLQTNDNLFLINNNNNTSITSNNSLFASEIQDEFCGRLINLTRSFINSEFDISEINFNHDGNNNFEKNIEDNLFNDDDDYNDYNYLLKNKSKKTMMMHPNEILNKIQNEDLKNKKVIHHYSNSLKVNSNLEKLEEKINNDEDNINTEQFGNLRNMIQSNNCFIF